MNIVYQIAEWGQFENHKSRGMARVKWYITPNELTPKTRRLLAMKAGLAYYAVHTLLRGLCSRQKAPRDGWLTDDGTSTGEPLTAADLAFEIGAPEALVADALEALCSAKIGWIRAHKKDTEVSRKRTLDRPPKRPDKGHPSVLRSVQTKDSEAPLEKTSECPKAGHLSALKTSSEVEVKNGKTAIKDNGAEGAAVKPCAVENKGNGEDGTATAGAEKLAPVFLKQTEPTKDNYALPEGNGGTGGTPVLRDDGWEQWTLFGFVLRRWGFGDDETRRLIKAMRVQIRSKIGAAPTDYVAWCWNLLAYVQQARRNPNPVQDQVAFVIALWKASTQPERQYLTIAREAWRKAEEDLSPVERSSLWTTLAAGLAHSFELPAVNGGKTFERRKAEQLAVFRKPVESGA